MKGLSRAARLANLPPMRLPILFAVLSVGYAACGSQPPPTSTTPATPGSAVILPSPASAEAVPKSTPPAASPSASQ